MRIFFILIFTLCCARALCGCDSNSNVAGESRGVSPQAYRISPSSRVLDEGDSTASFTVIGGDEPFSWSVSDTALGSVSESTGRTVNYQRTAGIEGVNTIEAIDANGNRAQAAVVQQALVLTPGSVTLTADERSANFTATGGSAPFRWSVVNRRIGDVGATTGRTAVYLREDVPGINTIRVQDADGRVAEAVVSQEAAEE